MGKVAAIGSLLVIVAGCSDDKLAGTDARAGVELCDRGECDCEVLGIDDSSIDFGSPEPGEVSRRTLTIRNDSPGRILRLFNAKVEDPQGLFGITSVERHHFEDGEEQVTEHEFAIDGSIDIEGEDFVLVHLGFRPSSSGAEFTATLKVRSDSNVRPDWDITLRGGLGNTEICGPSGNCGQGIAVDFGNYPDSQLASGIFETRYIEVRNTGMAEAFVDVELTDDGIPPLGPNDQVGDLGIFAVGDVGCTIAAPGQTLQIPVIYNPRFAGEHHGEVVISGMGDVLHVPLSGRVLGAHICFRTEDDVPNDATLQYGDAPDYEVAVNTNETRRAWIKNCGIGTDLSITSVTPVSGAIDDFTSPTVPLSQGIVLEPGAEQELLITYQPDGAVGSTITANWQFSSNDIALPESLLALKATIGPPEQCSLIASPNPVDFGWVATDDAGVGCNPSFPGCPGLAGQPAISRTKELVLTNAGKRSCTNVMLGNVVPDSSSAGMFSVQDNPNGGSFTVAPGASSQPMTLLYQRTPQEYATNHSARISYSSPDMPIAPIFVDLKAKAGGSPNCALDFQPVSDPTLFCPNERLNFGNVNAGQTKIIDLKVTNVGSDVCNVHSIGRLFGTDDAFSFPTAAFNIAVGASHIIPVAFDAAPPSGSIFEEVELLCVGNGMRLTANTGATGVDEQHTISFQGKAVWPDIDVIPGEIDFGDVTVGCCSAPVRVSIYNSGDGDLTIEGVEVLASSDPGFSVDLAGMASVVTPNGNTEFYVQFCADDLGAASGVVEITSSDDNDEYFTVSVSGNGVDSSEANDQWQQPQRPKVDVLWAIDDSGSMGDEQDALADNFTAFITAASGLDSDYHIGVVTTDVETEWSGKLYACSGNPLWIDSDSLPSVQELEFRCNSQTTDSGRPGSDSQEAPLQAARSALDFPNIDDYNAGFYRDDASLYIITVTDENDQSDGTPMQYVDFFRNLKGAGNPDLLNISSISGPPPGGCSSSYGDAEANTFGKEAVDAVGGEFRSICTADWSDLISDLGIDVFNARRQFALSRPATASTIVVKVCDDDGAGNPIACVEVPQDAANGWTFDAGTNSVIFNGSSVPDKGEHIVVEYLAVCY